MRKDKENAREMRRAGKSYREIRDALKIPVATLSDWFSKEEWSKAIEQRLRAEAQVVSTARMIELDKVRGAHLIQAYAEARKEAADELQKLKYNPLFIAGMMLYWGEGDKTPKRNLKLSNSDPELIKLYVEFLTRACGVPMARISAHVLIYPDHEEMVTKAFWSRFSGIPSQNFTKCVTIQGRHKVRRLTWGVCIVTVSSTYLKEKVLTWVKLLPKELMDARYYEKIAPEAAIV